MNNEWARQRIYTVTMIGTRDGDRSVLGHTPAPTAMYAVTSALAAFCTLGGVVYPCVVEATEDGKPPKVGARMTIQTFEHGECDLPDWTKEATEIVESIRASLRFSHGAEVQDVIDDVLADAAQLERLVAKHEAARRGAPEQHVERCPCGVPLDEPCLTCFPDGDDPTPENRRRNKLVCPKCGGTSWGGGTDANPRPWCNNCGEDQPGWEE